MPETTEAEIEKLYERLRTESLEEVLANTCKDLATNAELAAGNIRQLMYGRDFRTLSQYYVYLEYANLKLSSLIKPGDKVVKSRISDEEKKRRNSYLLNVQPGRHDIRKLAKDLGISPKELGSYFRFRKEELRFRNILEERNLWEKY